MSPSAVTVSDTDICNKRRKNMMALFTRSTVFATLSFALIACGTSTEPPSTTAPQASAPQPAPPQSTAPQPDAVTPSDEPIEVSVEDFGFGLSTEHDDFLTYSVILANTNDADWAASGVQLEMTWFDAAGSVLGRETARIFVILPGQLAATAGRTFDVESAGADSMRVQVRTSEWIEVGPGPYGGLETSDVTLRDASVTGLVQSFFDAELTSLGAFAVFRDANGQISGGWSDRFGIDFIAPGGQASVQVYRPRDFPAESVELFVQLNSLSLPD